MYRYRSLFEAHLDECDIHAIRKATEFVVPLGGQRFKQQIENVLGRSVGYARRGRPEYEMTKGNTRVENDTQLSPTPFSAFSKRIYRSKS